MTQLFSLGNSRQRLLTAAKVLDIMKEAQVDSTRLALIKKWLHSLPGIATVCQIATPYGSITRVA